MMRDMGLASFKAGAAHLGGDAGAAASCRYSVHAVQWRRAHVYTLRPGLPPAAKQSAGQRHDMLRRHGRLLSLQVVFAGCTSVECGIGNPRGEERTA
jgi:hypothetical protein